MPEKRPTTVAEYIKAAPREGQPHLRKLRSILRSVAPHAEEVIKWNAPFYIEPRFLFSFSACRQHCNFAPSETAIAHFAAELGTHRMTKNYLQIPYDQAIPEDLVRRIAEYRLSEVNDRDDDSFW